MGFHQMFEQVPLKPTYNNDSTGKLPGELWVLRFLFEPFYLS